MKSAKFVPRDEEEGQQPSSVEIATDLHCIQNENCREREREKFNCFYFPYDFDDFIII